MPHDAERLFQLRDGLLRDARRFEDAAARPVPGSARDASGSIEVALDDDGAIRVTIADGWRSDYAPDGLAEAVLRTSSELRTARIAAWATHVDETSADEHPSVPVPPADESVAGRFAADLDGQADVGAELTTVLTNVLGFLDDVAANFDATVEQAVQRGRTTHGSDPATDHVAVEVGAAGDLTAVRFSEQWVSGATGSQISRDLNRAIEQARAAGRAAAAGPFEGTPLAGYQRFLDDPDGFVRFVRGKE